MQNIRQTNVKKMNEIEEKLNYITQAKVNNIKDEAFERVSKRIYQVEKIMN